MEIGDLGARLRARRTAAGRTIASVAADAGLSVPYIANLENGRGNPTLSAVRGLATALGARLIVDLADDDDPHRTNPSPALPESLVRFAGSARFSAEAGRLAGAAKVPETAMRERLLHTMADVGSLVGRSLVELDWHRILDAVVLISRA
jgi:transcriptional regulator with XRE-family HTH domain